ncbi:hypothetical protein [Antarcticirhabdus aurantiaca]|uniref:Uncharacterized protein n=1 Tax=Antarcticirhabdus aurantiaca TaxID=2606717 RepID=A0ACD4NN17_9HYPH|nr:hypothetical protein [Antarcticirhabdus aurantiaca]WAJ28040.1 hypothetical protein OXU80_24970 [Jeongeuplla avenae]
MANHKLDLATVLSNVTRLLDLASWMSTSNMTRTSTSDFGPGYHMKAIDAEQLDALLIVMRDYAEHQLEEAGE